MNSRILLWSLISAMAGFLFGFDTVVISGAERTIKELWGLSDLMHGVAIASALYGTVLGAVLGGIPTDRLGRRPTMLWIGILYFFSSVGSGLATDVNLFIFARFIGGIAVGVSTVVSPLYIAEIAPPERRGRLAGLFQFNIVFGILIAFASNALLAQVGGNAWRWMLGVQAGPALLYTVLCLTLPESPRWLIARRGQRAAGILVLEKILPGATPSELEARADEIAAPPNDPSRTGQSQSFWSKSSLRRPIVLAFLIAFFNQFSGINAILYFAPRIFELTGLGKDAALLQSVGIGVTNLIFTFIGLWLIDHLGRRTLLLIGSFGYIISLGLTAWAFYTQHFGIVPVCIFAFIAAHAVGQGAVIWVFISEIFPSVHRASGQALGSSTHWVCAALISTVFPSMVTKFAPGGVFLFFCGMMVLQLFWVLFMVRETKGIPLEEVGI